MIFIKIWNPVKELYQVVNLNKVIEYHFTDGYTWLITEEEKIYTAEGDITKQIATTIKAGGGHYAQLKGE